MEINKAINIAIDCVMSSLLDTEMKQEIIDSLRKAEEEISFWKDLAESCECNN